LSRLTREGWLQSHAYLRGIDELCAQVERTLAALPLETPRSPSWDEHREEFLEGVPLFQSSTVAFDLEAGNGMVVALAERLASDPAQGERSLEAAALAAELRQEGAAPRVVSWLLGDDAWTPRAPGFLRFLGWTALRRLFRPTIEEFARWRDEERWLRSYCPTCGSGPTMGQLVGKDPGRKRHLSCGRCGTLWQYKRSQCPFCEEDAQQALVLTIEGEAGLRIDRCASCQGYLKTYDGQGDEELLLADWSSLHLDVLATDRGWKRLAASLYELPLASADSTELTEL